MTFAPLYIVLCAFLVILLTVRVVRMRWKYSVSLGNGQNPVLERAIRAHANAVETMPIALLLLLVLDLWSTPPSSVYGHILGGMLVVGRICHAYQVSLEKPLIWRIAGMSMTLTATGLAALGVLYKYVTM